MGNSESQPLQKIQVECGYAFKNKALLEQALTHDSLRVGNHQLPTYQRLEFLGDAVLQVIITDYLYYEHPTDGEGALTQKRSAIVGAQKQLEIAHKLELENYVMMSASNAGQPLGSRFKRWDKFVEALLGAIYVDAGGGWTGHEAVKKCVHKLWGL